MKSSARIAVLSVSLLAALGCVRNPATGKRQLTLVSEGQEVQLGQQAKQEVAATVGLYPDERLQAYVSELGMRLAKASERPELPWSFQVLDDPSVNAFALPGGPIFVTRGILTHMGSEAELVGVLGHEIGHVTGKHAVAQLSKAQVAQVGLGLGSVLFPEVADRYGQLAGASLGLLLLKNSRDAERQADALGFEYLVNAGYDARRMGDLFRTLAAVGAKQQGRLPSWLSTHPDPEDRLEDVQERLAAAPNAAWDQRLTRRPEFLARVDGLVFGENPRQGFFRGNSFLHPDLAFELEVPQGFRAQNTPQALVAVSPGKDALVVLQLTPDATPQQAAQRFFQQPGVQAKSATQGSVNQLPAVASYFTAQTEQGPLTGLVSFLQHGGRTFQVLGFTSPERLGAYDNAFRLTAMTFRPLSDPSALAVQPARLQVVTLSQPMTLEQFQAQSPSTVSLEELERINAVARTQTLPAGTRVKRVVGGVTGGTPAAGR